MKTKSKRDGKHVLMSMFCLLLFICGSVSALGLGKTTHLLFLSLSWCQNLYHFHFKPVHIFNALPLMTLYLWTYCPLFFCLLIGWMCSDWHHHCLREHCSQGLRSRCPYIYKYDDLNTSAINNNLPVLFKESKVNPW